MPTKLLQGSTYELSSVRPRVLDLGLASDLRHAAADPEKPVVRAASPRWFAAIRGGCLSCPFAFPRPPAFAATCSKFPPTTVGWRGGAAARASCCLGPIRISRG